MLRQVTPEVPISLLWHPRLDADPAHRWLRGCVRDACAEQLTIHQRSVAAEVALRSIGSANPLH